MERRQFTREFKLEAGKLVKDRGVSYARAAEDLGVHPTQLRNWVKALAYDPEDRVCRPVWVRGRPLPSPLMGSTAPFRSSRSQPQMGCRLTYLWTAEGWLYVSAVIYLFSRRVVGWSMQSAMTAQLVTDALVMAIWLRGKPDAL